MTIDLNRGVTKRIHRAGVEVFMYKDAPGVFLNCYGEEVSHAFAKEAGYDVEYLLKVKSRNEKVAKAVAKAEAELEEEMASEKEGGFKLVKRQFGWYDIVGPEGEVVNQQKLRQDEALAAIRELSYKAQKPEEGETDGEA